MFKEVSNPDIGNLEFHKSVATELYKERSDSLAAKDDNAIKTGNFVQNIMKLQRQTHGWCIIRNLKKFEPTLRNNVFLV